MKRTITCLALLAVAVTSRAAGDGEHHVKANLVAVDESGVTGFVQITQLPQGGSNIVLLVKGLEPGRGYSSFYYESADCSAPSELLDEFQADSRGNGRAGGSIDRNLDELGSISVRLGPGFGTLLSCATVR